MLAPPSASRTFTMRGRTRAQCSQRRADHMNDRRGEGGDSYGADRALGVRRHAGISPVELREHRVRMPG